MMKMMVTRPRGSRRRAATEELLFLFCCNLRFVHLDVVCLPVGRQPGPLHRGGAGSRGEAGSRRRARGSERSLQARKEKEEKKESSTSG